MTVPSSSREEGFSLIETLVALFVIALVSTTAGAMLLDTMRATETVDAVAGEIREMEVATGLLRSDLAAMTRRASKPPNSYVAATGPAGTDGRRDGLVLAFVRGGWADLAGPESTRSDLARVEYHRRGERLMRRIYAAPDPATRTPYSERVLFDDITDLNLRYFSDGAWSEGWRSPGATLDQQMPDLVELTVTRSDGRVIRQKLVAGGLQ